MTWWCWSLCETTANVVIGGYGAPREKRELGDAKEQGRRIEQVHIALGDSSRELNLEWRSYRRKSFE